MARWPTAWISTTRTHRPRCTPARRSCRRLAAAEIAGRSSQDALVGIIAGYEVICRISRALIPSEHYDLGFHPTATCGVFAAAAAAGRVLGLSPEQMEDAYGIALSEAAGSLQFLATAPGPSGSRSVIRPWPG